MKEKEHREQLARKKLDEYVVACECLNATDTAAALLNMLAMCADAMGRADGRRMRGLSEH